MLKNLATHGLDKSLLLEQDDTPVSAIFLFGLVFFIMKWMLTTLREKNTRLPNSNRLTISRKIFQITDNEFSVLEVMMNYVGLLSSILMQAKMVYKFLKTYREFRYIISMSRIVSRITGYICAMYQPLPMRYLMYGGFAWVYGINMDEVEEPDFGAYDTFTKFFTRKLKKGVRPVYEYENKKSMVSPADGRVLTCGLINSEYSTIDCVKGRSYRLDEFMLGVKGNTLNNDQTEVTENNSEVAAMIEKVKQRGNQLMYMVIYLSPADYHRFHSPVQHTADYRRHVVGYLSPVKPSYVNKHKDVFKNNERVNIFGRWAQGFYFESAVGATNVGSIKLDFDTEVLTNKAVPSYPFFEDKSYIATAGDKNTPFRQYLIEDNFS